jgi:hypothetical protein
MGLLEGIFIFGNPEGVSIVNGVVLKKIQLPSSVIALAL